MIEVTQVFVPAAECQGCGMDATVTIHVGRNYQQQRTLLRLCEDCSAALVEALS